MGQMPYTKFMTLPLIRPQGCAGIPLFHQTAPLLAGASNQPHQAAKAQSWVRKGANGSVMNFVSGIWPMRGLATVTH